MDQSNPSTETPDQQDIRVNKDMAAMSYVWILSVFIFFARRQSPFVRFHAKQGIVLFILSLIVAIVPFVGKYLMLLVLAGMVLGFLHAAQGRREDVPFVGKLSRGELTGADLAKAWSGIVESVRKLFAPKPQQPQQSTSASSSPTPSPAQTSTVDKPPAPPVP